jgi:hypothetical protein
MRVDAIKLEPTQRYTLPRAKPESIVKAFLKRMAQQSRSPLGSQ